MSDVDRRIREIRPRMRTVIPQTYWVSMLFALFNIVVGALTFMGDILYTIKLITIVPIEAWGVIWFILGWWMIWALLSNNWKMTQTAHIAGMVIKSYWIAELLGSWILGGSPFVLVTWILIFCIQGVLLRYFDGRPYLIHMRNVRE